MDGLCGRSEPSWGVRSILVDKEIMAAVSEIVQPNDFYASLHESIYLALYALYEAGKPLDKVALAEELRSRGMLDKIGGMAYLSSLMDTVQTAASAEYYAKIVREKASLRGLIHAGTKITQLGYESEDDVPARTGAVTASATAANRSSFSESDSADPSPVEPPTTTPSLPWAIK